MAQHPSSNVTCSLYVTQHPSSSVTCSAYVRQDLSSNVKWTVHVSHYIEVKRPEKWKIKHPTSGSFWLWASTVEVELAPSSWDHAPQSSFECDMAARRYTYIILINVYIYIYIHEFVCICKYTIYDTTSQIQSIQNVKYVTSYILYMSTHIHTCIFTLSCIYVHMHIYIFKCMYIWTYLCVCMYVM